jgi:hypothetical protein
VPYPFQALVLYALGNSNRCQVLIFCRTVLGRFIIFVVKLRSAGCWNFTLCTGQQFLYYTYGDICSMSLLTPFMSVFCCINILRGKASRWHRTLIYFKYFIERIKVLNYHKNINCMSICWLRVCVQLKRKCFFF